MKIKDLPEEIRIRALKNQVAQGNKENPELELNDEPHDGNFDWESTPEGWLYWNWIWISGNKYIEPEDLIKVRDIKHELLDLRDRLNQIIDKL